MSIMNEYDMFMTLLNKAKHSEVDEENKEEFNAVIAVLRTNLSMVKMEEGEGFIIFTKGNDRVKVSIEDQEEDVSLSYVIL